MVAYKKEIIRKIVHMIAGAVVLWSTVLVNKKYGLETVLEIGLIALALFLVIDFLRIERKLVIPLFSSLQRKKEEKRLIGITYASLAFILVISFFDFKIALAALSMNYFGDALAAIVGRKWGRKKIHKQKTLQGTIANLLTCLVIGFFFIKNPFLLIAMALTATLVELFLDQLDDNLYVPFFTGLVGQAVLLMI